MGPASLGPPLPEQEIHREGAVGGDVGRRKRGGGEGDYLEGGGVSEVGGGGVRRHEGPAPQHGVVVVGQSGRLRGNAFVG